MIYMIRCKRSRLQIPILKSLYHNDYSISVVYTQPPHKSHRGQKINKSPIQDISEKLNIDLRCPENLRDNDEHIEIKLMLIQFS